jgi:hypothetical protein
MGKSQVHGCENLKTGTVGTKIKSTYGLNVDSLKEKCIEIHSIASEMKHAERQRQRVYRLIQVCAA